MVSPPRPPPPPPPPAALSYDSYQQGSACAESTRRCVQHAIPLIVAVAVLGLVSLLLYLRRRRRRRRRREETVARTLERVPHDAITMAVSRSWSTSAVARLRCGPRRPLPAGFLLHAVRGCRVRNPLPCLSQECRICCEEYAHGSRKRILPCNHGLHPAACLRPPLPGY